MGRQKIIRECSFKPVFTCFSPNIKKEQGVMELNSDEMEAVFLMDYEGLYQEDAALKMNISRPTLSRIIKSAHQKIATALIRGYTLQILEAKDKLIVAFPTAHQEDWNACSNTETYIALAHVYNQRIVTVTFVINPLSDTRLKPSTVLATFLKEHEVTYWLSTQAGEGLKNALLAKGIFYKKITPPLSYESIPRLFC